MTTGFALALAVGLLSASCGRPVGSACAIEGSGFTARDVCSTQCLSRWTVQCPEGDAVMPQVCAGRASCQVGGCPDGQACYHFDDPFAEVSYCIPDNVCGAAPAPDARLRWERSARDRAAEVRARFGRSGSPAKPTKPAEPVSP
jgi:hypothetical protein